MVRVGGMGCGVEVVKLGRGGAAGAGERRG